MTRFHSIPPMMQVALHEMGQLDDPDYTRDKSGGALANMDKLRRYMAENNGELPF